MDEVRSIATSLPSTEQKLFLKQAERVEGFLRDRASQRVDLAGPDRLIKILRADFPAGFKRPIVLFDQDLAGVSPLELLKHVEPHVANWENEREAELVAVTIGDGQSTIAGFDEVLADLQKGRLRTLVLARGLDAPLHQCLQWGWVDRSADPVCSICGGKRRAVTLRSVLSAFARREGTVLEVVNDGAADQVKDAAGWLRQPKSLLAGMQIERPASVFGSNMLDETPLALIGGVAM